MKQIVLLMGLFFVMTFGLAQEKKVKKGNQEFEKLAYINSRDIYLKVAEKGFESQDLYQHLGDSYYFTAELVEAKKWYELLMVKFEDSISSEYYFRYAQSLKSIENYSEADIYMNKFYQVNPSEGKANYLEFIEKQSGKFDLISVTINSENSDFAPMFYQDQLVFASSRSKGNASKANHKWNNQPFSDLYLTSQEDDKENIAILSKNINTKFNESTAVFTKDGTTVYFTRNNYTNNKFRENSNGINLLKIYRSNKVDDIWQKAIELPFNSDEFNVAHPALSPDEKTLYFASDMQGGKGFSDLYKVTITEDGFSAPESLGDAINTLGRETFPFIATNGDLYFSSDGHSGLGGLDVFVSVLEGAHYNEPYNIGKPINSPLDDFTFIINSETGIGYFASNREGGIGSDDIYSFKQTEPLIKSCVQTLSGIVKDKNTNIILPNAILVLTDGEGNVLFETVSGIDGSFIIESIYCNKTYALRATMLQYDADEVSFVTSNVVLDQLNKTLYLTPIIPLVIGTDLNEILNMSPVYFDLNKSFIRADAQIELQKVIAFMKEYPNLKIDIRSHTDSRGNDNYNLKLSQRRNDETLKYIIDIGGISSERITGMGYGESQLVNECSNGVKCSNEEHQLNRRSEFIITEN